MFRSKDECGLREAEAFNIPDLAHFHPAFLRRNLLKAAEHGR